MRAALVSVSMLATSAAIAADVAAAEDDSSGLAEIVVTARKKSENLQDTPISISAFDSAEIKSARIERLADLAKFTPGLNFTPLFGAQNQLPIIRGAAQTFGQLNVGVFLDGVYLSGKAGVDLELNDLQRIEVVKGPQSALYGRNTFAGAINYVTARPTEELTGGVEGTAGENGLWKVQGSMSGQIAKGIRVRAGAFYRTFDGFYKSSIDGGQVDFAKNYGGILTVELAPTERLLVTLRGTYSKEDNGQPPSNVIAANNFPGAAFAGSTIQRNLLYTGTVPSIPRNGVTVDTLSAPGLPGGTYGDREEIYRGSAEIAYDFDGAKLTSITAYANRDFDFTFDGDNVVCRTTGGCQTFGAPFAPNQANGKSDFAFSSAFGHFRDFSQELRLQSTGTGKLQWLVGFFYYNNETLNTDRGFVPPTSFPITTYANQAQAYTYPITKTNTKAYSGFGSVNYQVTDKFGITAELRYEHEDVQFRQNPTNARPANDATVCAATATTRFTPGCAGSVAVFNLSNGFKFWTPRLILNYKANDDLLVYASYARGAKTGGFNSALNITDAQRAFFPEYSNNFEVGFKSDLADKRVRLNMAAFYTDWQDQQAACQNAPVPGV
ncbi:MAG: TonB-dependent receptor, partial [Sphingomonadales bacterium]